MLKKMISILAVAVLSVTVSANVQAATITVQKGDTLWDLSRANNTSVENIQKLNHLTTDLIHPGDVLTIAPEKHYTVKQGDTLWDIAIDHQVTVSQIKEWNQLHTDLIHPGLNLLIFEGLNIPLFSNRKTNKACSTNINGKYTCSNRSINKLYSFKVLNSCTCKGKSPEATAPSTSNQLQGKCTCSRSCSNNNKVQRKLQWKLQPIRLHVRDVPVLPLLELTLKQTQMQKVISVDPSVIPLGSKVYVEGYGEAIAGDTGGAIKGNRIDVFIPSEQDAINFGVKQLKVTILN